jgi:hypothetical protein
VVGKGHADEIGEPAAIFDAADRLQPIGRAERHAFAGVGVAAPAAGAFAAADLERHNDEVAGDKILHGIADIDDAPRRLVPQRKRPRQAGPAAGNRKVEIAARHRQRGYDRIAIVLELWLRHIPPLDLGPADIGELAHVSCLRVARGRLRKRMTPDKRFVFICGERDSPSPVDVFCLPSFRDAPNEIRSMAKRKIK